ncbi:MAG TPA: endonuclease domain-containing protein [Dongiaceae bacterium]|nr:endonuclease domain-containing protein [Dongiaceae bacterium]
MSATSTSAGNARRLRRRQTDAERRFWLLLRDRRLQGWKFHRQVPLGPYIADFYCAAAKLIVELDGGQHAIRTQEDERRTAVLESLGFVVIRYWNHDVLANSEGVLSDLRQHLGLHAPLTLSLSRKGRGNAVSGSHSSRNLTEQSSQVSLLPTDNLASTATPSSRIAKDAGNSVPSPLAGEGQGEGVLDTAKNDDRGCKP